MTTRAGVFLAGLLWILHLNSAISHANEPTASEVLHNVDAALGRFENVVLTASITVRQSDDSGETSGVFKTLFHLKRGSGRVLMSSKHHNERSGESPSRQQVDRVVGEDGAVMHFQSNLDDSMKQVDGLHPGLIITIDSKTLSGSQEDDSQSVLYGLNDGGAALWVVGYASIREMLKSAKPSDVEFREGVAEIRTDGTQGRMRLVVSEASGWLPQTFEIAKSKHHQTIRGLVGVVFENMVTAVVWTGKVTDFHSDSTGRWWPGQIEVVRRTEWIDKPVEVSTTSIVMNSVEFDVPLKAEDFQTSLVFPVNFPVTVEGADHLPYKWNGSAPVPGVPDRPPRPNKVYEETTPANRRIGMVWLGGASILLFVAIIALLKRRH